MDQRQRLNVALGLSRLDAGVEAGQLAISAADLAGRWTQDKVLEQLTALADASVPKDFHDAKGPALALLTGGPLPVRTVAGDDE